MSEMVKFKRDFKYRRYRFLDFSLTHRAPNGNERFSKWNCIANSTDETSLHLSNVSSKL